MVKSGARTDRRGLGDGRILIGSPPYRRSVFLESSWNASSAVSRETPFSRWNVSHNIRKQLPIITTQKDSQMTHSRIILLLVCMVDWVRKGNRFSEPMASEALNAEWFSEKPFWEVRRSEQAKPCRVPLLV